MKALYTLLILLIPCFGFGQSNSSPNKVQTDIEDSWKIISNLPFLNSEFRSNCDEPKNVETNVVIFVEDDYIILGMDVEMGGTIMMTMYNSGKNLYKIIFAHDIYENYGDDSIHEFFFKYQHDKIVFPNKWWDTDFNENSISNLTYHNCH
jgi:hypothetical protein